MIKRFGKTYILKNLSNIPGWRTKRHLIVIESDDWGSIRMPSRKVFDNLIKEGIDLLSDEGFRFNKYDSLATAEDLALLFETISSVQDYTGRPAVITPVSVVANPDFLKIQQFDFREYYYEPFTETLKKYPGCENSFALWKDGIENRLFIPQFHGREHLNVKVWMRALRGGNEKALLAFNNEMWGISTANDPDIKLEFQAAFDFIEPSDLDYQKKVLETGLNLFEKLFNYRASYFVPPNGPFSSKLEKFCANKGVSFLWVPKRNEEPLGQGKMKKKMHYLGQKSNAGLTYITRNCLFEPIHPGIDWVDSCLYDISNAFRWHKPAIISSHRLNFIGALDTKNRENGLSNLKILLKQIMRKWPNAEFITSAELGKIINND